MPDSPGRRHALAGLYPILSHNVVPLGGLVSAARALATASCTIMQLRLKGDLSDRRHLALAQEAVTALHDWDGVLCVNDRADIAALVARDAPAGLQIALHLGQDDLPAVVARDIVGPDVLIGLSTHNEAQIHDANDQPIDYIGFGPIAATRTKATPDPTVGLAGLTAAVALSAHPVAAIGGIDPHLARAATDAGAAMVAVASALFDQGRLSPQAIAAFQAALS